MTDDVSRPNEAFIERSIPFKAPNMTHQPVLPRCTLGKTGVVLPVLGFGVSGPLASRFIGGGHVQRLVNDALAAGIELFDTAPFYGKGDAEKRLGKTLASSSNLTSFVCTKGGTFRKGRRLSKDFSIAALRGQIESSLKKLPQIDLFLLHGPADKDLTRPLLDYLQDLKAQNKVRFLGVAGRGAELEAAIASHVFDVIMAPAHMNLDTLALNRLEKARTAGLGIIGIECLSPAARQMRISPRPSDLWYSARSLAGRRQEQKMPDQSGHSADTCLSWTLKSGLVDIAMITTTRPANLHANILTACRSA